ncbi:DUF488 domain-containing protein [Acidocella sp. KAb 2-4]|uniref:DUF488 domain-containing protein n=1 Tax=Acidocella sp. KAb 2-4 TaxID=2885158 RepID=UPI001D078492|nr:DUF488 domain-containing protein [Acidocella sp. KAb 2-4]MCB5944654.1 DUF488 domain-containing protein [Acidocella sp. KAb 2-4]
MTTANPDLHVKRVYDPPATSDGARVLVDRLWPRGLRKENAALTLWLKEIAPSAALRQWFGHDPARWAEFQRLYRQELKAKDEPLAALAALLRHGRVTLLYGARDTAHNHALVLASFIADAQHRRGTALSAAPSTRPVR